MRCLTLIFTSIWIFGCSGQNFQTIDQDSKYTATAFYQKDVDVLWVIDNSYINMKTHTDRIKKNMNVFHSGLENTGTNYRVAATTMDMSSQGERGDLIGSVVEKNDPNAVQKLESLLTWTHDGSDAEKGLEAMKASIQKQIAMGNAASFLREDALLVIVFVTDDKDFSASTVSSYETFLNDVKGENTEQRQNWIANFIGITDLNDPNCKTYGSFSGRGDRYIDLAQRSGGVSESICYTDFSSYLDQVTVRLKSVLNEYILDKKPILDSLAVYKNGVLIRKGDVDGWSYNAEKNSVFLNGSAKPGPNDKIDIKYELGN